MDIAQQSITLVQEAPWHSDWMWGFPITILTVIIHTLGLSVTTRWAVDFYDQGKNNHRNVMAMLTICAFTFIATCLHGLEASLWAALYLAVGALPDARSAMLFSLGALTTYGHNPIYLADHWQLLGGIEALNGLLLFGLSTAYLFWLIQALSPRLRSFN
jgi:hypothetical protein